jgi:hypothetical protein
VKSLLKDIFINGLGSRVNKLIVTESLKDLNAFIRLMGLFYCGGCRDIEELARLLEAAMTYSKDKSVEILQQLMLRRGMGRDKDCLALLIAITS